MDPLEELAGLAYEDVAVAQVIRPAAVLPEAAARVVLVELAVRDVRSGGCWLSSPSLWQRWSRPWDTATEAGASLLLGSLQVSYGTPTRYAVTIFRVTITRVGGDCGFTVESLCDEALSFGGYTLLDCPRAALLPPPTRFRMH